MSALVPEKLGVKPATQLALMALAIGFFAAFWIAYPIREGHSGDFLSMLSHRQSAGGWWDGRGVGYGPIFALYDLALRGVDDVNAMRLAFAFNHLLMLGALVLAVRRFLPNPTRRELAIALFVWFTFYPSFQTLRQNNVEVTELFFLMVMLTALSLDQPIVAGIALGLAGATKFIPLLLVAYFVWRRAWKVAASALMTVAFVTVAVVTLKGETLAIAWEQWSAHAGIAFPNTFENNQALSGLAWRAWSTFDLSSRWAAEHPVPGDAGASKLTTLALSAVLALAVLVALVRSTGIFPPATRSRGVESAELAIALLALIVLLPHNHTHYFVLVAWAFLAALREWPVPDGAPRLTRALFFGGWCLLGPLVVWRLLDPVIQLRWPITGIDLARLWSVPLVGALLLLAALLMSHAELVRRSP